MKLANIIKGNLTIFRAAQQQNKSIFEIRKGIQEALDEAWSEAWAPGNIHAQVKWQRLFPGGKKPTVEECIVYLGNALQSQNKTQTT